MLTWLVLGSALAGGIAVVLVAGATVLFLKLEEATLQRWMPRLIALAVGVLLGDAFLHLLPDALERSDDAGSVFLWTLLGILVFYAIEQGLFWRHQHDPDTTLADTSAPAPFSRMNLLGDGIHNFTDGVLIAGSFLTDLKLGVATTVAILIHEIPQEIGDIAVLMRGGYSPRRAVTLNLLCATTCILGVLVTLAFSCVVDVNLPALLALTAGGFIYIATTDLIPLLRQHDMRLPMATQLLATAAGVTAMQGILWLEAIPH